MTVLLLTMEKWKVGQVTISGRRLLSCRLPESIKQFRNLEELEYNEDVLKGKSQLETRKYQGARCWEEENSKRYPDTPD